MNGLSPIKAVVVSKYAEGSPTRGCAMRFSGLKVQHRHEERRLYVALVLSEIEMPISSSQDPTDRPADRPLSIQINMHITFLNKVPDQTAGRNTRKNVGIKRSYHWEEVLCGNQNPTGRESK